MHLLLTIFLLVSSCALPRMAALTGEEAAAPDPDKVLIVYLSRTSNTKAVAEIIHQQVGGTLVALELEKPYPSNYQATVQQVARENETGYLPPIKTKIDRMARYDVVFVGFPTWGMQLPPPIKSFLRQYDLKGKTIVPFNTNGGYGVGSSFETVKALYLVLKGEKANEVETNVKHWLKKLNLR